MTSQGGHHVWRGLFACQHAPFLEIGATPIEAVGPLEECGFSDRRQRTGRGWVYRASHTGRGGEPERRLRGGACRLVEQLVAREVKVPPGAEQIGRQRLRAQAEVGTAIGEHGPLTGPVDQGHHHPCTFASEDVEA